MSDYRDDFGPTSDPAVPGEYGQGNSARVPARRPSAPPTYVMNDELLPVSGAGYYDHEADGSHLWDYLRIVSRRRWTIAAVFAFCLLVALVVSFAATPMYKATALLQIQANGPNVVSFDDVQDPTTISQAYSDFFQTQYDILSSRRLARRTIDRLDLAQNAWLNGDSARRTLLGRMIGGARTVFAGERDPQALQAERDQELVDNFQEHVEVRPRRKSLLVEVSFLAPDPSTAADVARMLVREYVDLTLDQRIEAASQGRDFIAKQLAITKGRLEESEQQLQEFARGRDIFALEQEEKVIHERLTDLNNRFTEAEAERIRLEALYKQVSGPSKDTVPLILQNPLISKLNEELADALAERAELGGRFTAEYPSVRTLDARIAQIRRTIDAQEQRLVESIRADFQTSHGREALLREQLDGQRNVVAAYEEKAIDFKIMRREVDTNRGIYENLLRRFKEVEVTEAIRASNITLVDSPETPLEQDTPNIPLNLALSMVLGLFGGLGLAFFQEYMDDSIKSPDDVERYLRLPTLGAIPEFSNGHAANSMTTEDSSPDLVVSLQPTSAGAEAIRTLRASLFLAAAGGLPSRLLITSAKPNEGKTCIAVNLAAALAQMGRRIVVLDCDLRRPRVHKAIAIAQSPGVTNYLTGNVSLGEIIHESGQPGLDIIPAGPVPPNPVDLLDSARIRELIRELDERYDHIVVDAPPALGFADVPVLTNRLGGGCLLVTRAGDTPQRLARQACEYLIRMQSKLLGVVLNRVSTRGSGYSYYGYYGYYGYVDSYSAPPDLSKQDRVGDAA